MKALFIVFVLSAAAMAEGLNCDQICNGQSANSPCRTCCSPTGMTCNPENGAPIAQNVGGPVMAQPSGTPLPGQEGEPHHWGWWHWEHWREAWADWFWAHQLRREEARERAAAENAAAQARANPPPVTNPAPVAPATNPGTGPTTAATNPAANAARPGAPAFSQPAPVAQNPAAVQAVAWRPAAYAAPAVRRGPPPVARNNASSAGVSHNRAMSAPKPPPAPRVAAPAAHRSAGHH